MSEPCSGYDSYNYYPDHTTDVTVETGTVCTTGCRDSTLTVPPHTVTRFRFVANP